MQTFLPRLSFRKSAKMLDYRRLGKQRSEAKIILNTLKNNYGGWYNHPAVLMWKGYENALSLYMNTIILEWINRGYKNNMKLEKIKSPIVFPPWLGDKNFHASHRSNLLRKDPIWYSQFNWEEPMDLPYVWPVTIHSRRRK